jgi:hypothetical protein
MRAVRMMLDGGRDVALEFPGRSAAAARHWRVARLSVSAPMPSPPVATVATTGMPSSSASAGMSTVTPRAGFVVHVQRQHHRHAELGQQRGEVERAAQVLGVADLDQAVRMFIEQRAHGGALVVAARGQGEHARGVEQRGLTVEAGVARDTSTVVPG